MRSDLEFASTKTYTHSIGLSCCFRQWRASSHCKYLHGYALEVRLQFASPTLDSRNWVVDFGDLKEVKQWLESRFDHKLVVAYDDPMKDLLSSLANPINVHTAEEAENKRVADVVFMTHVGCEYFSFVIYEYVEDWLKRYADAHRLPEAYLESVEVREHQGNSAICRRKPPKPDRTVFNLQPNHIVEQVGEVFVIRDKDTPYEQA